MKQNDFLRFALVLSDGQATTFKKNLTKIIELVVFDCYGEAITIAEITKRVKEHYSLIFSNAEIKDVFNKDHAHIFVETHNAVDPVYSTYTITPEKYDKLKKRDKADLIVNIASRFIAGIGIGCTFTVSQLKSVVYRYIYEVFNTDIITVLSLMNYQGEKLISKIPPERFTADEIICLNAFLNWDDLEKNKLIYDMISSCYEYCMMTVKKDNSSYSTIFNSKEFYLDANIVFRLAGFNNDERREVVTAFLNKCHECGVIIKYTNFTNVEIESTLEHIVDSIRKLLNGQDPICIKAMERLSSKYANLDLYEQYIEWTKKPGNKTGDYSSFLIFLKHSVTKYLTLMQFAKFESFEDKSKNGDFERLCEDFTAYKSQRCKGTYEGSIKVDVENYLYMMQLDATVKTNSFLDKKQYFITADHTYIDWAREKIPGAIPTFVLPSVWYSLMLKYNGRTDDDYNAFCQFLNLRTTNVEGELNEKKEQMLESVLRMEESSQIKEEIIFDIDRRLAEDTSDIEDIEAYVEESHTRITEGKVKEAVATVENRHSVEKEALITSVEKEAQQKHDAGYKKGKDEGFSTGVENGITRVIQQNAKSIVSRNRFIRVFAIVISIVSILAFIVILILAIFTDKIEAASSLLKLLNENATIFSFATFMLSALALLVTQLNKHVEILSLNVTVVECKLKKRYEKLNTQ